jgi:type II secretory pathway predicted ATPase ExeA
VLTESHREALGNIEYGIARRMGMTLLIGEAGSGKTTVIRMAIEARRDRVHYIHLSNPTLSRQEFNQMIARTFGLSSRAAGSKAAMLAELETLLEQRLRRRETSVLVLDEAQSMPETLLEEVRLIANIETNDTKLLSIIVAGQPELAERLNEHGLRQLKQRVALRCEIRSLTQDETYDYVISRIHTAGGTSEVFTPDAIAVLHKGSRGLPRTINVIADNALLGAFAAGCPVVDANLIREICRDFDLDIGRLPPSTYFAEIAPPAVNGAAPARSSDDVATRPNARSAARRRLPTRQGLHQAVGYRAAAAAMAIVVLLGSAGLFARRFVRQPARPTDSGELTGYATAAAPAAEDVDRPSRTSGVTAPPDRTTRRSRETSAATPPRARPIDRIQPLSRPPQPVNAASPVRATAAVGLPADRVVAPPVRPISQPVPLVAASAAATAPVARRDDRDASDASRSGEPGTPARPPSPALAAAEPTASRVATPSVVAVDPPIQSVLDQYRRAFGSLAASEVERFWPSVNAKNLQRAFDQIDSQRIEFNSCVASATTANRAQVSCGGSATFVPRVGNKTPRIESRHWTFHLSRANAAWIIDKVESR